MTLYEHTVIRAVIPSAEDPSKQLRSPGGEHPAYLHERGDGTFEQTLHKLGRHLLGCTHLSVDRRLNGIDGEIVYQAKPLHCTPEPDDLFQWL